MKQLSHPFFFMLSALFASCTLFDSEYLDDEAKQIDPPVPVYTGEGYDSPVSVSNGDLQLTYQLTSNTRQLTPDYNPYVITATMDTISNHGYVDFSAQTPAAMLPVKGENLVCGAGIDQLPFGIGARVVRTERTNDRYRCYMVNVGLNMLYQKLDLQGNVAVGDGDDTQVQQGRSTRTETWEEGDWVYVKHQEVINLPESKIELGLGDYFSASIQPKGTNTHNFYLKINLEGNSMGLPYVYMEDQMDTDAEFHLEFAGKIEHEFIPESRKNNLLGIKGTIPIGPVLLRVVIPLSVTVKAEATGEATLHVQHSMILRSKFDESTIASALFLGSLANAFVPGSGMLIGSAVAITADQVYNVVKNSETTNLKAWLDSVQVSGSVSLNAKPGIGLGLYTQKLSYRFYFPIELVKAECKSPKWNPGEKSRNLEDNPGVKISSSFGVYGKLFVPFLSPEDDKKKTDEKEEEKTAEQKADETSNLDFATEFTSEEKVWENYTWYPVLNDKKTYVQRKNKTTDARAGASETECHASLKNVGMLASLAGHKYYLAMQVDQLDAKDEKTVVRNVGTYWDKKQRLIKSDTRLSATYDYDFGLKLEAEKSYLITPCLYASDRKELIGTYKPLHFSYSNPIMVIEKQMDDVNVLSAVRTSNDILLNIEYYLALRVNLFGGVKRWGIDVIDYPSLNYEYVVNNPEELKSPFSAKIKLNKSFLDKADKGKKNLTFKIQGWVVMDDGNIMKDEVRSFTLKFDESDRSWEAILE